MFTRTLTKIATSLNWNRARFLSGLSSRKEGAMKKGVQGAADKINDALMKPYSHPKSVGYMNTKDFHMDQIKRMQNKNFANLSDGGRAIDRLKVSLLNKATKGMKR